jgi:hypothetical protein
MADSSRNPACRRASVSVVSSAFSISRDRRATSDLSIARRSRLSISSSNVPSLGLMPMQKKLPLPVGRRAPRFFPLDRGEPQDNVGMVFATSAERGKTVC